MITTMGPAEHKAHIKSLCAQLTASLLLYKILKDKSLYVTAMKLHAWKHFHDMTASAGITAGLLISWLPVHGSIYHFILSLILHAETETIVDDGTFYALYDMGVDILVLATVAS
jgi:hypothetical protein